MKKSIKINPVSVIGIVVLVVMLVLVRLFQNDLFYDPLIPFFKKEGVPLPQMDDFNLFLGLAFRYFLNSFISLGILWLVFKDGAMIRLCFMLYCGLFMLLIAVFFTVLKADNVNLLLLFYVRRFLIQPLFLILFLPAFYYQKVMRS
jgi:exosortase F-associated protein